MKNKLLLFGAMLVAACMVLAPGGAFAQVTSDDFGEDPTFNITIPSAAGWSITTAQACTLSSDDFNFSGLETAVPNSTTACVMTFGDATTPVSFLVTNDPAVVGDNLVSLSPVACMMDTGGTNVAADTACEFTADQTFRVAHAVAPKADFNILAYAQSTGAGNDPTIGTAAMTRVLDNLEKADAVAMTMVGATNKYGIDLKLDLDESTLDEFDYPQAITVTLRFTVAGPTY